MKLTPGYYAAYRMGGSGSQVKLLSRCFPTEEADDSGSAHHVLNTANDWMLWERCCNPEKDVVLIQVMAEMPEGVL